MFVLGHLLSLTKARDARRVPSCAKTRPMPDFRRHCPVEAVAGSFILGNLSPVCRRTMANLAPVERRSALRQAPAMDPLPPPLTFFLLLFSGWINRHQQAVIYYLLEENRVLRAVNGSRQLRLTDDQRRRLAVKGHVLGRRHLAAIAGIVTPDTILRWYRRLVATKYDDSKTRRPGRPTRPNRATRRQTPPGHSSRVRGSLSRGTTAPGFGQRVHRAEDHVTRTGPNTLP
jgi:hypothetical protein